MFINYLKVAIRNLFRQKFYTLINILGLSIGITCSFLIFLYVKNEVSYDKHYKNSDRIYRLCVTNNMGGKVDSYCNGPRPTSFKMKEIYPEVIESTRLCGINGLFTHEAMLSYDNNFFSTSKIFGADSTFFKVFENEFVSGNAEEALSNPNGIVLTESFAKKIFGHSDVYGKSLKLDNAFDLTVSAVIKDLPGKTHLEYEALLPWAFIFRPGENDQWYGWHVYHYMLLSKNCDIEKLQNKFPAFYDEYMKETMERLGGKTELFLQSLESIWLHSNLTWEPYPTGSIDNVYIFTIIAFFLILIACINYMNLATARSAHRRREVGMRKVFGSQKAPLVGQFLTESILITLFATVLSMILAEVFLPVFNSLSGQIYEINLLHNPQYIFGLLLVGLLTGVGAGIYPAFFLSRFNPIKVLKGTTDKRSKGAVLRRLLIVVQFSISIIMIIGTLVVLKQLRFAKNKDLGFDKENVMIISIQDSLVNRQVSVMKETLLQDPNIISVATSFNIPGTTFNRFPAQVEGDDGEFIRKGCQFMQIDYDFVEMMKMNMIEGRSFNREQETDYLTSVMINKTAMEKFGWSENPIGKKIFMGTQGDGDNATPIIARVVGVVDDFHNNSLHKQIHPILIYLIPDNGPVFYGVLKYMFIRFKGNDAFKTIEKIKKTWSNFDQQNPIQYHFLEERLNRQYGTEEKLIRLFSYFAFITIFIASLGLFGLASFTAEQRTKEIGIRKILGSSISNIVILLSKDFAKWILIANIIAWPVSIYFLQKWLQNFAYHTTLDPWIFILAGVLTFLIAIITVSFQTLKAASANPIESIKYE